MTDPISVSRKAVLAHSIARRRELIAPLAVQRITVNNGRLFVQGEPPSFSPTEQIGRRTFPNRISLFAILFQKVYRVGKEIIPAGDHSAYMRCPRIFQR